MNRVVVGSESTGGLGLTVSDDPLDHQVAERIDALRMLDGLQRLGVNIPTELIAVERPAFGHVEGAIPVGVPGSQRVNAHTLDRHAHPSIAVTHIRLPALQPVSLDINASA